MGEVVLELVCPSCEQWLVRWTVKLGQPFDHQCWGPEDDRRPIDRRMLGEAWNVESPGMPYLTSTGMQPPKIPRPRGEEWDRVRFQHGQCETKPQARLDKLEKAAATALRYLYDTQTQVLRTTVDKLLLFAA
jgi:hypothetical protein